MYSQVIAPISMRDAKKNGRLISVTKLFLSVLLLTVLIKIIKQITI